MDYIKVAIDVIGIILSLFTLHFVFFALVGIFKRKTYPVSGEKLRYAIVIPARNEEHVVGAIIESIRKNKYPQDKVDIFVVAHNCTDITAQIARRCGAIVYEYNNPAERTKGYALHYLFNKIEEDYGINAYAGYFILDTDNILDEHYIGKMNDAFIACNQEKVITSFRNSKNFGSHLIAAMYGIYFVFGCRYESRGRTYFGCSTRVQGTGYVIPAALLADGWNYLTITEDWEFTADQLLRDNIVEYCDEAVFYDEQPTDLGVMWRQRLRWSKGHLLVCITRYRELLRNFFKPMGKGGGRHKVSLFDALVNMSPICIFSAFVSALTPILYALSPLFGRDPHTLYYNWLFRPFGLLMSAGISYALLVIASALVFVLEARRIRHVSFGMKVLASLFFPLFFALSVVMEVVALFTIHDLTWTEIPHKDNTTFDDLRHVNGELFDVSTEDCEKQ